jgi:hypothetical protein
MRSCNTYLGSRVKSARSGTKIAPVEAAHDTLVNVLTRKITSENKSEYVLFYPHTLNVREQKWR